MIPNLPRELLWQDLTTMDEFFQLDPLNEEFYSVFAKLQEPPFAVHVDAVKVFNEVYYQTTRMVYERSEPSDLPKFVAEIKADLGWNYSAELVMTMIYFINLLQKKYRKRINGVFSEEIRNSYNQCKYWRRFRSLFHKLKDSNKEIKYSFVPHPEKMEVLQTYYIPWRDITNNYDIGSIEHILNGWYDTHDKQSIARMIEDQMSMTAITPKDEYDYEQVKRFLQTYLRGSESKEKDPTEHVAINLRVELQSQQIQNLTQKIEELKVENEELSRKCHENEGGPRKISLTEIVAYCKKSIKWEQVDSIVAMLNKMLRVGATQEEIELVDSVEEEFKNRVYGNTFVEGDYVNTKHVTNEVNGVAEGGTGINVNK